jgi:transcriptional regulator with XRE-family HTH domain
LDNQKKRCKFVGNKHHYINKYTIMTEEISLYKIKRSDDAIIKLIGNFIKQHRLQQNITQQQLATKAGINRTTLSDLELGRRCQLLTLIQVLRILNKLYIFDSFDYRPQISPIQLAEMEMKLRKRAKNKKGNNDAPPKKKSDW